MYNEGQKFILKNDVTIGKETFTKGSKAEIFNVVKDSIAPYNILFIDKAVVHMAFNELFIEENFQKS